MKNNAQAVTREPDDAEESDINIPSFKNNDIFHIIAKNTSYMILHFQVKPAGGLVYVSPSSLRIIGYAPEEFYADTELARRCVHPDDYKLLTDFSNPNILSDNEPLVLRGIHKDGRTIWIELTKTVIHNKLEEKTDAYYIVRNITERKMAEDALRESQRFNASLLENAPHATVVINPDTSIRYVNPAWEKVNGWSLAEVIGMKAPYPWWPEEYKETFSDGFKEAMKQDSGKGEVIAQKKNGELYWIDMNWTPVTHNGELQYLLINSIDITERKQAEEKQQAIIKTALDGFWTCNLDGKFLEVNDSYCKMIGYTREELLKMSIQDIEAVENPEQTAQRIKKIAEEGSDRFETQHKRKDGKVIDIEISVNCPNAGEGQMFVFVRDITGRKRAQEALRVSEEKYRSIFESANDLILLIDDKGKILDVNSKMEDITGFTREEIVGNTVFSLTQILTEESLAKVKETFKNRMLGLSVPPYEIEIVKKDGQTAQFEVNARVLQMGGKITGDLAILRDITERKQMENALRESEEKFSRAFHASPEIIAITTMKDGKYVEINESYTLYTGYTRDELADRSSVDMNIWAKPGDREKMLRILEEKGRVRNIEFDFRIKSGEIRTWLFSAEPITIEGEPCLIGASIDITERKRVEVALANEAVRRRILIEQSRDGIVILDQNGKVYEANQRFADMLGYSLEEVSQLHVFDWEFLYPREQTIEMIKTVDEKGDHFETQHRRKDGTIFDVEISTNGATFAGQKLIFCVCRDITGRKQMEKALRESEAIFSSAFRSSPDLMAIVNLTDGNYVKVNDTFVHFIGYTREELIGHSADEFNLWVNLKERDRMTRLMEEQGKIRHEEYHFRTKSGEIRTWWCSADIINIGGEKHMLAVATDITDRKKAQEALRESEEKFSKAFHASPVSVSISRLNDGKFIEVNESFLRDNGYTRKEIIGYSSAELNIWATPGTRDRIIHILSERGRIYNEQVQFRTKSGHIRTGLVSAEIISIGNQPCMMVLNTDITQQKLSEERLRLLGSVTQQVSDSTIVTDRNFKITYMNKAAQDLFGYSDEEALGKHLNLINPIPMKGSVSQDIFNTLASGKVWTWTVPKKRKDGRTLLCDCRLSPLYDEKGQILSYIDVLRDVTEQKEVEAKLQAHKKLIESILATMPEGVLVIDGNDRIILANEAFYKIFHLSKRATKNKMLCETIAMDQLCNLYKAMKRGKYENNTLEFRYQVQDLDKIIYCVVVKMDRERTLLTFADISKEREKEEKLYLTDRLASIGEMAAGLAHELNNPLTGIIALSQLLVNSDIQEEHKEDLQSIHDESKRAASIVKNVLLFARNNTYENGQASVNEVVKDVLRLREYEEKAGNIGIVTNLEDNLPAININKYQLQQVFLNIILNAEAAIKETNRPGILTVTTERANNHVNIMFQDNGCGIKKHIMPRIFDPFFTTKEIGKGTGLGLSICYSIVVKHGGKISVKSQVNEGSTFTIRMPILT